MGADGVKAGGVGKEGDRMAARGQGALLSLSARRIPEMGDPGGLPSMGSQRIGHD